MESIGHLSIREIARAYRKGTLSPVEVVDACLAAIEARNSQLNAFVTLTADEALAAGRAAEERLRVAGDDAPPLCGIPFSVKDTLPTAGVRTTFGSRLFADFVPAEDCAAVAALKRAGAIMLGKTNTPALGWIGITHNKLFGATPNPWNLAMTAGGSSGGAAVAALTGLAPINIGTDGGGSLRLPASFTGTVGFKPSYGRVPNYPTGPNWGLQHIGPIARRVEDIAAIMDALAVPDDRDPYSLPARTLRFTESIGRAPRHLKVLFCPDFGYAEAVDREVVTRCREAIRCFRQFGYAVTEGVPGWSSPLQSWQTLFVAGVAHRLGPFVPERAEDIEDKLREFIETGKNLAPDAYYRAWLAKNEWWQEVRPTFEQYDLVASPVAACPPFALGAETPGTIDGKPVSFYGWLAFTVPFNMTGQPAISVPAGFTGDGLPVGLQIVGRRFADDVVLAVAAAYERAYSWPIEPPPTPSMPPDRAATPEESSIPDA
jgi:aspartyl-tRNA(Asn)/glutamyl-tRNA(Gln) amidotransferase subunit A